MPNGVTSPSNDFTNHFSEVTNRIIVFTNGSNPLTSPASQDSFVTATWFLSVTGVIGAIVVVLVIMVLCKLFRKSPCRTCLSVWKLSKFEAKRGEKGQISFQRRGYSHSTTNDAVYQVIDINRKQHKQQNTCANEAKSNGDQNYSNVKASYINYDKLYLDKRASGNKFRFST